MTITLSWITYMITSPFQYIDSVIFQIIKCFLGLQFEYCLCPTASIIHVWTYSNSFCAWLVFLWWSLWPFHSLLSVLFCIHHFCYFSCLTEIIFLATFHESLSYQSQHYIFLHFFPEFSIFTFYCCWICGQKSSLFKCYTVFLFYSCCCYWLLWTWHNLYHF